MRDERRYQLALTAGGTPPGIDAVAESVMEVTPSGAGTLAERVVAGLRASGVTPADLRARTLLVSNLPVAETLAVYAAVAGFAGRHVDVATASGIAMLERPARAGREAVDAGKPDERADCVLAGGTDADEAAVRGALEAAAAERAAEDEPERAVRVVRVELGDPAAGVVPAVVSALRWGKRVRMAVHGGLEVELPRFAFLSGVRAWRGQERFPALMDGTDLDGIRQEAGALRRSLRNTSGAVLAESVEPTERQARLAEAAAVPIESVLGALGSQTDGKLWQCPRPGRHTHGDATPSLRVDDNRVCCYVDDAEWVDPLRLLMETLSVGPDDAADLLLDLDAPEWGVRAAEIAAVRAAKAA